MYGIFSQSLLSISGSHCITFSSSSLHIQTNRQQTVGTKNYAISVFVLTNGTLRQIQLKPTQTLQNVIVYLQLCRMTMCVCPPYVFNFIELFLKQRIRHAPNRFCILYCNLISLYGTFCSAVFHPFFNCLPHDAAIYFARFYSAHTVTQCV